MKKENSYPICYNCAIQLNPQDSGGWRMFGGGEKNEYIHICPNCINEKIEKSECEKCGRYLSECAEYYECKLIDNMGLSVSKKICLPCFDIFMQTPCG